MVEPDMKKEGDCVHALEFSFIIVAVVFGVYYGT
jgi:hypothetical protein